MSVSPCFEVDAGERYRWPDAWRADSAPAEAGAYTRSHFSST